MSKTDCLNADWQQEGYKVGIAGEPRVSDAFDKREKLCSGYGAKADWVAFEDGYSEGVDEYCAVPNAVKLGASGIERALETCPESEYFGFFRAFSAGYKLFELNEHVRQSDYDLSRLENSIYNYQRQRENLRRRLESNELTEDQRRYAVDQYRRLGSQINYLRSDIRKYQSRLYSHQRAADKYARYLKTEFAEDSY